MFKVSYLHPGQIPHTVKELDEVYAKDEKIMCIDLEVIADELLKQKEEEKF